MGNLENIHSVSPNGNNWHNYTIISKPENWHWYNPDFIQILPILHACICVYIYFYAVFAGIGSRSHHCNQDTELVPHHRDSLWYSFIITPFLHPSSTHPILTPGNHSSVLHHYISVFLLILYQWLHRIWDWLLSFCIIPSKCIQVVACIKSWLFYCCVVFHHMDV